MSEWDARQYREARERQLGRELEEMLRQDEEARERDDAAFFARGPRTPDEIAAAIRADRLASMFVRQLSEKWRRGPSGR